MTLEQGRKRNKKALTINKKIDKFDNNENFNLCISNTTIKKGKRQVQTGRKHTQLIKTDIQNI